MYHTNAVTSGRVAFDEFRYAFFTRRHAPAAAYDRRPLGRIAQEAAGTDLALGHRESFPGRTNRSGCDQHVAEYAADA